MVSFDNGAPMDFDPEDEKGVPYSDSMAWYKCLSCGHLHVRYYDPDMKLIFLSNVSRDMLINMLKVIDEHPMAC